MKKLVYILLAEGFEELEAFSPADILRRIGVEVRLVGVTGKNVRGAHGIEVVADVTLNRASGELPDAVVLPGGMPGAKNLDSTPAVRKLVAGAAEAGKIVAAICAAPMVLGRMGLLQGKHATCYPGFEDQLDGALLPDPADGAVTRCIVDGNFVTANGPGAAAEFGFTLGRLLSDEVSTEFVRRGMLFHGNR